jgi:hypothetical protein
MLLGQLGGNGDSVERIDDDPLQVVFREVRHADSLLFGMLFSSTISCSAILWQRVKKGNWTFAQPSTAMIADQTQPRFTNFHEILTKKGGNFQQQTTPPSPSSSSHSQLTAEGAECS